MTGGLTWEEGRGATACDLPKDCIVILYDPGLKYILSSLTDSPSMIASIGSCLGR
jgi:hypothetical protein